MARYTDIDALIIEMEKRNNELFDEYGFDFYVQGYADAISKVENAPTYDVVPRSEVEQLQHKCDLAVAEREANVKGFAEELSKAKSEVASEVIDEFVYRLVCLTAYGTINISPRRVREIAVELKNKYTEEKK